MCIVSCDSFSSCKKNPVDLRHVVVVVGTVVEQLLLCMQRGKGRKRGGGDGKEKKKLEHFPKVLGGVGLERERERDISSFPPSLPFPPRRKEKKKLRQQREENDVNSKRKGGRVRKRKRGKKKKSAKISTEALSSR